jgi:hypothetical protein
MTVSLTDVHDLTPDEIKNRHTWRFFLFATGNIARIIRLLHQPAFLTHPFRTFPA